MPYGSCKSIMSVTISLPLSLPPRFQLHITNQNNILVHHRHHLSMVSQECQSDRPPSPQPSKSGSNDTIVRFCEEYYAATYSFVIQPQNARDYLLDSFYSPRTIVVAASCSFFDLFPLMQMDFSSILRFVKLPPAAREIILSD
ncbi:hypothetical protein WG66_008017 [Moniliophthora roreri]|nr:hypothetical protein WG66_008017 [Moniliophthora roreri]